MPLRPAVYGLTEGLGHLAREDIDAEGTKKQDGGK